jgi:hypothetical protein
MLHILCLAIENNFSLRGGQWIEGTLRRLGRRDRELVKL